MQTLDRNLLTPGAFKYNSITQKTAPGKWKKKTHVILTSMATNKRTALTGVMSGSQWELLAAMPIKAQFVMTAMTPSASNAAFKKKKTNQPTKQKNMSEVLRIHFCPVVLTQVYKSYRSDLVSIGRETLDWRVDLLDKVKDCLTKKDGLLLSYRKFQSRIYISRTRAKESLWWQLILSNKTEWGKWPRFTISDLGSCVWCSN